MRSLCKTATVGHMAGMRDLNAYPRVVLVNEYIRRAFEFYDAYKRLGQGDPPSWPRYFLFCHAIELILKAFLFHKKGQLNQTDMKTWVRSHNIVDLFSEGFTNGLAIDNHTRSELELLNEAHSVYWARYPSTTAESVFVIEPFEQYLDDLLKQVSIAINPPLIRGSIVI